MRKISQLLLVGLLFVGLNSTSVLASSMGSVSVPKAKAIAVTERVNVSAVNGTVTVSLSGGDVWVAGMVPDFDPNLVKVTRSINGGPETVVKASVVSRGIVNNRFIVNLKVPMVLPTWKTQNVSYKVSYNRGLAVAAKAFAVVGKGPTICI